MESLILKVVLEIAAIVLMFALLYVIGGMGDNIKKIRLMLEEKMKKGNEA